MEEAAVLVEAARGVAMMAVVAGTAGNEEGVEGGATAEGGAMAETWVEEGVAEGVAAAPVGAVRGAGSMAAVVGAADGTSAGGVDAMAEAPLEAAGGWAATSEAVTTAVVGEVVACAAEAWVEGQAAVLAVVARGMEGRVVVEEAAKAPGSVADCLEVGLEGAVGSEVAGWMALEA